MSLNSRRKYFNRKKPTGSIALLILGALIFIFALSSDCNFILAIFGLALSAGAVYMITAFSLAHSDDTIDNFCNSLAAEYCAAKKATVCSYGKTATETVCTSGYCFENIFSARKARLGKDKVWRSSIFEILCVFFTTDKVYCYIKKISLISNESSDSEKIFDLCDIKTVSFEKINGAAFVAIAVPGDEKINIKCSTTEYAELLCNRIKQILYLR